MVGKNGDKIVHAVIYFSIILSNLDVKKSSAREDPPFANSFTVSSRKSFEYGTWRILSKMMLSFFS